MTVLPTYPDSNQVSDMAKLRRHLHMNPELSWLEFQTTAFLCRQLEKLGYTIRWGSDLYADLRPHNLPPSDQLDAAYQRAETNLGKDNKYLPKMEGGLTGLVATINGADNGPVFGFRLDIDALPIDEQEVDGHLPGDGGFVSTNPGVMHACGHDAHMAIGLGLAKKIAESKDKLKGKVHLFFQPAEEIGGGGVLFADLPELQEVDKFMTLHIGINNERRLICDATWVAAKVFDVRFSGRASHAGNSPQEGRNALLAACQAVQGLYALPRHGAGASRVNVGRFFSENANNVVADDARFRFEVRGANNEICDQMADGARRTIEGAALMNECTTVVDAFSEFSFQPNSPSMVAEIEKAAISLGLDEQVLSKPKQIPASEDAGYLIQAVQQRGGQAAHIILGCPVRGGHHNSLFDIDEDVMGWGVDLMAAVISNSETT